MGKVAVHARRRRAGYVWAMVEVLERRVLLSGTVAGGLVGGAVGGAVFSQAVGFVTSSTASALSFEALPAAGTLGSAVGPIKVDVDTRTGQVDTTSKASVTLSISSNGHVVKTLVVKAQNGVATFSNVSFPGGGTYTLLATSSSITSASKNLIVGPGAATHLVFLAQPADALTGESLGTVRVAVEDSFGNVVTTNQSSVTLSLNLPDAAGVQSPDGEFGTGSIVPIPSLQGKVTVAARNGVAAFSDLSINVVGSYTLNARDGTLTAGTSASVMIKSSATHLVILQQPNSGHAGLNPGLGAVTVALEDKAGNIVTGDSSIVTVTLGDSSGATPGSGASSDNPGVPVLQGTTAVQAENGVATFVDLAVLDAGTFTVVASDGTMTPAVSTVLTITPAPTHLVFLDHPTTGNPGTALDSISVAVEDDFGNVVTDYVLPIVLDGESLTDPSSTSSVLAGTTEAAPVNGIATFSNVSLLSEGTYVLHATGDASLAEASLYNVTIGSVPPPELAFGSLPAGPLPVGESVGPFEVSIEDGSGEVETLNQANVTLTVREPSGDVVQTFTVAAQDGTADFSGMTFPAAGDYSLEASGAGMTSGSTSVDVAAAGVASQVVFLNQPGDTVSDETLGTISVAVEDAFGNIVTGDSSITISLTTVPGSAPIAQRSATVTPFGGGSIVVDAPLSTDGVLNGTVTMATTNGVATFSDLSVSGAGSDFLTASVDGLPSSSSAVFAVAAPVGAPRRPSLLPSPQVVGNFSGSTGDAPLGGLVADVQGNLFGETATGGTNGNGTIFEIVAGSGTIQTIASFDGAHGQTPGGGLLMDAQGNLYGTTLAGGGEAEGTIFMVGQGSGSITTLASFNATAGEAPLGTLVMDRKGNLFGMTSQGGVHNTGTVFELAKGDHCIHALASFSAASTTEPAAGVTLDAHGNLFGMTALIVGGTTQGSVFELVKGKHVLKTVASVGTWSWGAMVIDGKGNLFGSVDGGGANGNGGVFEIAKGSTKAALVASFDGADGVPEGGLVMDKSGNLFGTFSDNGSDVGFGGVFEVVAGSGKISLIAVCDGNVTGSHAVGTLAMDKNGTLYGTTYLRGANDAGTVFSVVPPATIPETAKLVILQQPSGNAQGGVSVKVAVADGKGKVVTGGTFSITLQGAGGSVGAGLFTPVTVQTVNGVAEFDGVSLPTVAGTYKLEVVEGNLVPVVMRGMVVAGAAKGKHR